MITPLAPTGVQLRRAILLRRYENTLDALVQRRLEQVRQRLIDLLTRQDLTAVSPGRAAARLESIARQADEILLQAYQDLNALTRENLVELASVQSRAAADYLAKRVGTVVAELGLPTRALLRSIVTTDPIRGAVLWDWWQRQRIATRNAFRTQLQIGLTQGESLGDLIIRIRGRSVGGGRFVGGVMRTTTREAAALVRTSVNHIANTAAIETYKANNDITEEYEWVSTLDDRTTDICINLDGKRFRYDDPSAPTPPARWNCRSTTVPVIAYKQLGLQEPSTPDRQLYPDWFAQQPNAVQDEILGPGRARLVRNGTVGLADLVRRDGSSVPLSDLAVE